MQSAYKEAHSTDTALVRIQNDVFMDIDNRKCVFLVLLDLSAAFSTVSHEILIKRLSDRIGIRGNALQWIASYLENRKQFVLLDGHRSKTHSLDCNVPQGSVLGPGMFSDYNSPVADIFHRHDIHYHLYADDTQVYVSFDAKDEEQVRVRLEACLQEVRIWMAQNSLKLNDSKTDFIILGNTHNLKSVTTTHITIGECKVPVSTSVKNFCATLDPYLKLNKQVNLTCRSAWFNLYQIGKIKRYLSKDQLKSLIQAFVISKLDMNNSMLIGSPAVLTKKLQSVQNAAAKLVCGLNRWDHVDPSPENLATY